MNDRFAGKPPSNMCANLPPLPGPGDGLDQPSEAKIESATQ